MPQTNKNKLLNLTHDKPITLKQRSGWQNGHYKLSQEHVGAIQAAFFAKRPLLVRGGPGLGKSQLAHAIASIFDWGLMSCAVHYNTTIDDLLYSIDHVKRLGHANHKTESVNELKDYVVPGKLWQAIAPDTLPGFDQEKTPIESGTVMLIDEIDKADSTLPNALLEVLATGTINVPCISNSIQSNNDHPYFIVITSNEERLLPKAFVRRCAVLDLKIPDQKDDAIEWLMDVYKTHYKDLQNEQSLELANDVAAMVVDQRERQNDGDYQAGTSEFLDMIRALLAFEPNERTLEQRMILSKHLVDKNQLRES